MAQRRLENLKTDFSLPLIADVVIGRLILLMCSFSSPSVVLLGRSHFATPIGCAAVA